MTRADSASQYRVKVAVDAFNHVLTCDKCGRLPLPNDILLPAMKARARRHAAANPDHDVSMSNLVVTHFFARKSTQ